MSNRPQGFVSDLTHMNKVVKRRQKIKDDRRAFVKTNSEGMTVAELAKKCRVTEKTIRTDLRELQCNTIDTVAGRLKTKRST